MAERFPDKRALSHPSRVNCWGCCTSCCLSEGRATGGVAATLASVALRCVPMCFESQATSRGICAVRSKVGHTPRGNKRCFLNVVFQSGMLRGWSGSTSAEGTKIPERTGVFRQSLFHCKGLPLSQAEVKTLKNTVWKTPFGVFRIPHRNVNVDTKKSQPMSKRKSLHTP